MSIHPSLSASLKNRKQRSVLKRLEKVKYLTDKGLFGDNTSVYGLPKIKSLKIKIKKEKTEAKAATAATAEAPAGGGNQPGPEAKSPKGSAQAKSAK